MSGMRTCVIFNPAARGDKARRFADQLDQVGAQAHLKRTDSAGHARALAREGFETIVAAGGDGTINEVLNGIGDEPGGFEKARLGVLPLGTVNVFAREIGVPRKFESAWEIIMASHEVRIDLPRVEFAGLKGERESRYFAQLAGAGLDARAIELVKWQVKKLVGPLAYVAAGFHALMGPSSTIEMTCSEAGCAGELVLIGNGGLYGGEFRLFPRADLYDGLLEVCILPKVNLMTLARCSPGLLVNRALPASLTKVFRTAQFTLASRQAAPVQLDGEIVGHLPATFSIESRRLRVAAPPAKAQPT
jgi:YegS/Rv2252/BmrU family lipid kinase